MMELLSCVGTLSRYPLHLFTSSSCQGSIWSMAHTVLVEEDAWMEGKVWEIHIWPAGFGPGHCDIHHARIPRLEWTCSWVDHYVPVNVAFSYCHPWKSSVMKIMWEFLKVNVIITLVHDLLWFSNRNSLLTRKKYLEKFHVIWEMHRVNKYESIQSFSWNISFLYIVMI